MEITIVDRILKRRHDISIRIRIYWTHANKTISQVWTISIYLEKLHSRKLEFEQKLEKKIDFPLEN